MDVPAAAAIIAQVFATLLVALIFSGRRQMRMHPSRRGLFRRGRELGMVGLLSGVLFMLLAVLLDASGVDLTAFWAIVFLWIIFVMDGALGLFAIMLAMVDWLATQEHIDESGIEDRRPSIGRPRLSRSSFVRARSAARAARKRRSRRRAKRA